MEKGTFVNLLDTNKFILNSITAWLQEYNSKEENL